MSWHRLFFRAGAVIWIAGGVGHFILVDTLTLYARTRVSQFIPHAEILDTMEKTTLTFGFLGSTTVLSAVAGFSVWVALSLALLGITYLLLSRQGGVALLPFTRLAVVISAAFSAVAAPCFIFPATIGGVLATAFFVASWVRNER
jgi:hypothetical protein